MKPQFDPKRHHRKSIRLKGYDYSLPGAYFLTICTQDREFLFGDVVGDEMELSDAGRMVQAVWDQLPDHLPGVDVDAFVVMPNHVNGVILLIPDDPQAQGQAGQVRGPAPTMDGNDLVGAPLRGCPNGGFPQDGASNRDDDGETGQARGPAPTMDGNDPVGAPLRGCPNGGSSDYGASNRDDDGETGQARGPAPTMDGNGPVGAPLRGCRGSGSSDYGASNRDDCGETGQARGPAPTMDGNDPVGAPLRGCPNGGFPHDGASNRDDCGETGQARGPAPTMDGNDLVGAPLRGCPNGGSSDYGASNRDDDGETGQARGPAPTMDGNDLVGAPLRGCPGSGCGNYSDKGTSTTPRLSLPDVVHRFKSFTTTQYRHGALQRGWPPFPGRVWQRNYYEHIVRDERALNAIRQYFADNPARWEWDTYNPAADGPDSSEADLWRLLQEGEPGAPSGGSER